MDRGAKVTHAVDIEQALTELRRAAAPDLIMCDVALDIGLLVRSLATERICTPVVACGIGTDARRAVDAIRAGAKEYLPLPPDPELIAAVLAAVADESHQLIFEDEATAAVIAMADQIAPSDASILITGESGTGKEILARYVHRKSARATSRSSRSTARRSRRTCWNPNCSATRRAPSPAPSRGASAKFEEANGGTLLLDEISEMDARLQAKLLRAIQEREIDRVGGGKPVKVDIRIIATSNRDLADAVKRGTFREDLLYRLNVVNLRCRPCASGRKTSSRWPAISPANMPKPTACRSARLPPETERMLLGHGWRGNVRELENTIHRAVLLSHGAADRRRSHPPARRRQLTEGPIRAAGDPVAIATPAAATTTRALVGRTVADVERDLILDTLDHCLGNRTHAANILGISIRTLRNKLREYTQAGIRVTQPGEGRAA